MATNYDVTVIDNDHIIVEVGVQGPAGIGGLGVPSGGLTGQYLQKASDTDNDTTWVSSTALALATYQPSAPPSGTDGQFWYNGDSDVLSVYSSGTWVSPNQDDGYF